MRVEVVLFFGALDPSLRWDDAFFRQGFYEMIFGFGALDPGLRWDDGVFCVYVIA